MGNFDDYLNEQLKNDEFKAEYEALEPEFAIIQAMLDEADTQAENTSKRLTHDEVFSNIISKLNN